MRELEEFLIAILHFNKTPRSFVEYIKCNFVTTTEKKKRVKNKKYRALIARIVPRQIYLRAWCEL